jgi:hypothetical protein
MAEDIITQPVDSTPDDAYLTINRVAAAYLLETSKWANFLSIMGFVLTGIIVLVGLFAGSIFSMMPQSEMGNMPGGVGTMMTGLYLILGVVYFFPSWYLFKYAQKLKASLSTRNSQELVTAFENQKSLYKFWGIFAIIMLAIYGVMILFSLSFLAFK